MALILQSEWCKHCRERITLRRYASGTWDNGDHTVDLWVNGNGAFPGDQSLCEQHDIGDDIGSYGYHEPVVVMNRERAIHYLTHDADTGEETGHLSVPASRWGRNGADCAQVAWDSDVIISEATGEGPDERTLDHAMSLVVNDHDDVAYTFLSHGSDAIRERYADQLSDWGNPDAYNETGDPHAWDDDSDS